MPSAGIAQKIAKIAKKKPAVAVGIAKKIAKKKPAVIAQKKLAKKR